MALGGASYIPPPRLLSKHEPKFRLLAVPGTKGGEWTATGTCHSRLETREVYY
jgi:hypothetical protein